VVGGCFGLTGARWRGNQRRGFLCEDGELAALRFACLYVNTLDGRRHKSCDAGAAAAGCGEDSLYTTSAHGEGSEGRKGRGRGRACVFARMVVGLTSDSTAAECVV
jgi:hypothetical protein